MKIVCCVTAVFILLQVHTQAYNPEDADISQLVEAIPENVLDYLPDSVLESNDAVAIAESADAGFLVNILTNIIQKILPVTLKKLCALFGLIIILTLINSAKNALSSVHFSKTVTFVTLLGTAVFTYEQFKALWDTVTVFLDGINAVITALIPIMTALYTMGGNTASAAVNSAGTSFMLTIINTLLQKAVLPLAEISFGLSLCGSIGGISGISHLTKKIKSMFTLTATSAMTVLSFFLLFKTNIASASDGVAARTIKFAGSFIPVVGSSLGESVRTLMSGLKLIKTSVGFVGILIIFIITAPPLLTTLFNKICVDAACGLSHLLGCDQESLILSEYSSLLGFFLALQTCVSVLFIIELTIFTTVAPALGGS